MARQPLTPSQKRLRRRGTLVSLAASALLMAIFVTIRPLIPPGPQPTDDTIVIAAGALLLVFGLMLTIVHTIMPQQAPMPRHQRVAQVLNCLISGVVLLLPIFGARVIDPQLNFAIILVLVAISFATSWVVWRGGDELTRKVMKDSWAATYLITATALCIYAVGERLGLLSGVTAWGALGFVTIVGLLCSIWTAYRRGLDQPPADD